MAGRVSSQSRQVADVQCEGLAGQRLLSASSANVSSRPSGVVHEWQLSGTSWQPSDVGGTQTDTSVVSFNDWLYRQLLLCVSLQSGP